MSGSHLSANIISRYDMLLNAGQLSLVQVRLEGRAQIMRNCIEKSKSPGVARYDLTAQVRERWQALFPDSLSIRQRLIDIWLLDVRRRGAKLYSVRRSRAALYLSVQGKDRLLYKVKIDLGSQDIRIELNRSEWRWVKCERYLLSPGSLRLLAKRICPLPEGQAVVTVDLLTRMSLLCDAYRRSLQEHDSEHYARASTDCIGKIQAELQQYLIPEEEEGKGSIKLDHTEGLNTR